jgi:hypothetical protein
MRNASYHLSIVETYRNSAGGGRNIFFRNVRAEREMKVEASGTAAMETLTPAGAATGTMAYRIMR